MDYDAFIERTFIVCQFEKQILNPSGKPDSPIYCVIKSSR